LKGFNPSSKSFPLPSQGRGIQGEGCNMEKQIAYCGLICTDCPAYIATQNDDDEIRKQVVEEWTKEFKHAIDIKDINCDGCLAETGRVYFYCSICKVRKCGQEKGVTNCAYCEEYICETLGKYFEMVPVMKANLEEVRKGLQ
jgi:hypothetical protein